MIRADDRMDELWNAIREMEPTLGDKNKPLAIAASYALLKGENEKLTRERNALDTALRERDKQLICALADLGTMIRLGVWLAKRETGDTGIKVWAGKAYQLLQKYGLQGSPLRDNELDGGNRLREEAGQKLVYNKATKRIDKVSHNGLVLESFDPPSDC